MDGLVDTRDLKLNEVKFYFSNFFTRTLIEIKT